MLKSTNSTSLLLRIPKLASSVFAGPPSEKTGTASPSKESSSRMSTESVSASTDTSSSIPPPTTQPLLFPTHRKKNPSHQYHPQHHAEGAPRKHTPRMMAFPLGYKEAAHQWWTSLSSRQAEQNVLSFIPHVREATGLSVGARLLDLANTDPFGQRVWRSSMVQLSGKNRALNEFSIEREGEDVANTLVMLHGYGAGLGFFYKNFEPLTRLPGWKLYALDMLGMGNSSRPPFKVHAKTQKEKIAEAESWFIDALEEWRKIRKLEKFTLMGHSMGGYLAVSYALKYPGHLNKLILVSPVGIPEDPWAVNADMPEPETSTMAAEFTQDQESIVHQTPAGQNAEYVNAKASDKKSVASQPNTSTTPPKRPLPGWLVWLWDANVSPFSIVRFAGPLGPRFVSGWTARRFNHLPSPEKQALHDYSYALFRQRGSGEYALPYLLAPGAYARSPVINRIQDVGRQVISPKTETTPEVKEHGFPIVFMYGENDWMDVAGGYAAEEKIKKRIEKELLEEGGAEKENGSVKVVVVRKAGHHLYVDNPEEFNEVVRRELKETMMVNQRRRN
ncbi:uncharacterized protein QC761_123240 [Podospora bellae-mahoneyi]|uniref:AB hydrolase-1 domain-containing protein n=1 Tax=Podospora bellae-mahoneyi TaxID=2093777 RepID=A0ABR0FUM8_9PEZI|nr:hypothetical protein QC761_123240 [Podospora bellae-mahoneyi]